MDERLLKADTIVFDIGNVLLRFDPDKVALLLPASIRQPLMQVLFGPQHLWGGFDLGAESNEEIARRAAGAANLPGTEEHVLSLLSRFPETMAPLPLAGMLRDLRQSGKHLYALTNYPEPSFTLTAQRFPFVTEEMDGVVVSSREKRVKPDPELFRILCRRYGIHPNDALFIDDTRANTDAAALLGFRVWHYTGTV